MSLSDIARFNRFSINTFLREHVDYVEWRVRTDPETFLRKRNVKGKDCLEIDLDAEQKFRFFTKSLGFPIEVNGEEDIIDGLDLTKKDSICVLVDMVDGTDLLERGLHNWCASAVFYHPRLAEGTRIIAAFIALPGPKVYTATRYTDTELTLSATDTRRIEGPDQSVTIDNASICFYGQKVGRLNASVANPFFSRAPQYANLRLYTLAGMPMITKICDPLKIASNIDAVFELIGQKPHDVVPGAFIAMRSGCTIINLDTGDPITQAELENSLLKPFDKSSDLRYLIAANEGLADDILKMMKPFRSVGTK